MAIKKFLQGKAGLITALIITDGLFFGVIDPTQAPSIMFIVAFSLATVSLYILASSLYRLAIWYGLPLKHQKRAVLSSTGCLMGLIALQSVGQLSTRDIVLLLPFVSLAYFYFSYQKN